MSGHWDDEKIEITRQLVDKGYSHRQIAKIIGLSQGSVSSKCHRLGIKKAGLPAHMANTPIGRYMQILEYSTQELADAVGCKRWLVQAWIQGKYTPGPKYREKLYEALGVWPGQLGF